MGPPAAGSLNLVPCQRGTVQAWCEPVAGLLLLQCSCERRAK